MTPFLPAELIGSDIEEILVEEHVSAVTRTLISVYLARSGHEGLRLKVAANGWGLVVGSDPPRPVDVGTSGAVVVRRAEAADGIPSGRVVNAWVVRAARSSSPVGLRWVNDAGDDVVIYGYDDTLLVAPPDRVELDDLSFVEGADEG